MTAINKDLRAEINQEFKNGFRAHLLCDGYVVTARWKRLAPSKLGLVIYVDGQIQGKWVDIGCEEPETKFMRQITRKVFSKNRRDYKNIPKKLKEQTISYRQIYWLSEDQFIKHLNKVCQTVRLLSPDEAEQIIKSKTGDLA